jgi:hypothetical protein
MIAEHWCTYSILYFHQEKGFRDPGVTRTGLRVMPVLTDGPRSRPAAASSPAPSTAITVS